MENQFNDFLVNALNIAKGSDISSPTVIVVLVLSLILGLAIAIVYQKTFKSLSYTSSFILTLILLPLITSLVLLTIGSNLARAFGLVGALAIIRFRTPVKDPKDIVFIFLALATGVVVGTQNYHIAIIGVIFILAIVLIFDKINFGSFVNNQFFLTVRADRRKLEQKNIEILLQKYCKSFSLNRLNSIFEDKDMVEIVYKLTLPIKKSEEIRQKMLNEFSESEYKDISLVSMDNYVAY
jgi:uncharacterized membrane protein YhiD involved in acid resistance